MKITTAQKIKLGLFVMTTIVILTISLYLIGKKQHLFGHTIQITAVFSNVNGLKTGNNVRYSGINMGTVQRIVMVNDSTICVDMILEETILKHMKKNAMAVVGSDGLVGSMVINIFPGEPGGSALQEGDTLQSVKKVSTTDMMSTLSMTNENAEELSRNLLRISQSINDGKSTLGLLVKDEDMGADLRATMANLKSASQEATGTIVKINEVMSSFDEKESLFYVLVKDSVAGQQFRTVMDHLEESSANIDQVIVNLNEIILKVKNDKGMFNYLVSDTVFVNNIDETVRNIKQGSFMLNENLEAMRQNFLFRGYFKKQEKERKKEERKLQKQADQSE